MKKLYLVPHMHWDREWYFSSDTANVLLHSNIKEMLKVIKNQKQFFDGQWSLIDDYLKNSPEDKQEIIKLLKEKKISSGPFYSQPDVFNSQAETIIRNIEIGGKVADELSVPNPKTAYLPDTFGFGKNLINIFKEHDLKNFVFWRGLPQKQVDSSVLFKWENEHCNINSLCLKDGYYSIGMYYPYNGKVGQYPEKWNPKKFAEKVLQRMEKVNGFKDIYIFPLGGDQAPFIHNQNEFLALVQKELKNVELIIMENYDEFFEKIKIEEKFIDDLWEPYTGKIHRTIASSRYDIKKLFRDAENKLYGQLEPLEVYFKTLDPLYDFEKYKEEKILKPLLIAQTHDSLGACNTDSTNFFQLSRLLSIHENIDSQIDLLIKRIMQHKNAFGEELMIFNPSLSDSFVFTRKIIFTAKIDRINIDTENVKIRTLSSKNISYSEKGIHRLDVLIYVNDLKPLSELIIDPMQFPNTKFEKSEKMSLHIDGINLQDTKVEFDIVNDEGDSYDFSPGDVLPLQQTHTINNEWNFGKAMWTEITSKIQYGKQRAKFTWNIFKKDQDEFVYITTKNKLKNVRVSLKINSPSTKYSQNLGIKDVTWKDVPVDWKDHLHEYPVNIHINDGLIQTKKCNILTFGTNELFTSDGSSQITLFRTYANVTSGQMKWRPVTSGLSWKEASPDSQLQKDLKFEFVFSTNKNVNGLLNMYRFRPLIYKTQTRNFIEHKMSKFVINNIFNPKNEIHNFSIPNNIYISSFRDTGTKLELRLGNLSYNTINETIKFNKFTKIISLKPNQIKTINLIGEKNEK